MTLLPLFIIIPVAASILEYLLKKLRLGSKGIIPLVSSILCVSLSSYVALNHQPEFIIPWISRWGIDFSLGLNDTSTAFIILLSLLFLILNILWFRKQERPLYWRMSLLIQALIFNFVLTQNLAIRVLSWEFIWIPMFMILINTDRKHYSLKFSYLWFFAQILLISGTVIMLGKFEGMYGIAFWLFFIATISRSYLSGKFDPDVSIITTTILPLLPIIFLTNTILPLFPHYVHMNTEVISIFICAIIFIWIMRLAISKAISTIYISNIFVLYSLVLIWLLDPGSKVIQLCIQIIVAKSILNVLLVYHGSKTTNSFNKWVFLVSLMLSFGFGGIIIGIPIAKLLSIWTVTKPSIMITMLCLLFAFFIVTSIKLGRLFNTERTIVSDHLGMEIIKLASVLIIVIGVVKTCFYGGW